MAQQNYYVVAQGDPLAALTNQYVVNAAASLGIRLDQAEIDRIANGVMHTLTTSALKICKV